MILELLLKMAVILVSAMRVVKLFVQTCFPKIKILVINSIAKQANSAGLMNQELLNVEMTLA
jgi:hypothetical protein